ncbi:GATase domain-containing protein [Fusarium falciforme]|uniref:GATase domain-containing protein n=1 Tax=Fusarium falciforme TaxID=195108 RepID=UPI002301F96E|nr:GATase domain-containing protein [Fusarium falciforme]WAO92668.1 GATase domain-containing protein [Fusarium falciforme]
MTLYFARKPRVLLLLFLLVTSTALFYTIAYRDTRKMGSAAPLRLAILEADTPQPQTRDRYGGYTGVFTALLNAAANSLKPPQKLDEIVTIKGYDVVNELHSYPALEDIDAILITGSRHTAFDNDPWIVKLVEYTKKAIETDRVRVVGICFGHQIIGRAAGAKLGRSDKGWEIAVTEVDLTAKGKEVFGLDKMRIHQMHRDIVFEFPPNSIPLGSNAICEVQAFYSPGRYISVQGHPEFTDEIISEILFNRHTVGIFSDELYADAMKRAPIPHDGVAIARAFLKFMREG